MKPIRVKKLIRDRLWQALEPAVTSVEHSAGGAPADRSVREFVEAVLSLNRTGCPWRDWPRRWAVGLRARCGSGAGRSLASGSVRGKTAKPHDSPRHGHCSWIRRWCVRITMPPARQKSGPAQVPGLSLGGLITKIHAATIAENCSVARRLTQGLGPRRPQF